MNKQGGLMLGFIFAFFIFLIGMWFLPFIKDSVTDMRTDLNCTSPTLTDGTKVSCLTADVGVPFYIIIILVFIGGLIGNEL